MRLRLPLALFVAASASVLAASPALANPRPDLPKSSDVKSNELKLDDGKPDDGKPEAHKPRPTPAEIAKGAQELCERGDTTEALTSLTSLVAQKPDPEIASALATCEASVGRWASAADHLRVALAGTPEGPARAALDARLADARSRVGTLTISVNVEGADVFVGNRFVGQTPLTGEVFADPGKSTVTVKKLNFDEMEKPFEVAARGHASVKFELVAGGQSANPYNRGVRSRVPAFVLGGIGLAAAGVGVAFYAAAISKSAAAGDVLTELKSAYSGQAAPCQPSHAGCSTIYSLRKGHDLDMNVGTGLVVGGAALFAAGALYGVWAFSGDSPAVATGSIKLAPVVSPAGSGLWLTGTF